MRLCYSTAAGGCSKAQAADRAKQRETETEMEEAKRGRQRGAERDRERDGRGKEREQRETGRDGWLSSQQHRRLLLQISDLSCCCIYMYLYTPMYRGNLYSFFPYRIYIYIYIYIYSERERERDTCIYTNDDDETRFIREQEGAV